MSHTEYQLIGCPGSGKTTTLSRVWLPRAVEKWGAGSVAVCSLTRTAAAEIASRDSGVPKDSVGTLHALCFRALGRPEIAEGKIAEWNAFSPPYALSGGPSALDEPDMETRLSGKPGDQAMALAQVLRHRMVPEERWPDHVRGFYRDWKFWCREAGYTDFTGLIEESLRLADTAPGNPRVLVVDEVQDSSALELSLIRKWAQAAEYVVLAGDPWQAIYEWRGADPEAFVGNDLPEGDRRFLSESHRCPKAVHAAAMLLVEQASKPLPHRFNPRASDGRCARTGATINYPDEILRLIETSPGTTMILASCGYQIERACAVLRREGIPFHNPYRTTNGRWNPLRGGARRLASFLRPCRETWGDLARSWTWKELHDWTEMCQAKHLLYPKAKDAIKDAAKTQRTDSPLTAMEMQGMFQPQAWQELLVARSAERGRDEAMTKWLDAHLLGTWGPKVQYAKKVAEKRGSRSLVGEPKVVVGTIHSVKGGQADRVVVFPDLSMSAEREMHTNSGARDAMLRLFYVAMTRAREELFLAAPSSAGHIRWRMPS